ncbi:MAG: sensor histidine kinase [Hydrococcus sp. RM1_1_31]|nr:sensor histidine kinase [Hydrococcus sp. RM1_1_31]
MDEKLLNSILTNLLFNAVKYSPPGSQVDFNVTLEAEAVVFAVKDRGIGILPQDREYLFEAFHRGENVGQIEGSGLGLALVKKCVNLHRGQIAFDSIVGEGTTFIIRLPIGSVN